MEEPQQNASRTPSREDALSVLERVRQAAKKDKKSRFTALLHHIYDPERLREAYFCLKKEAAPGVDGETWRHYGETLADNLQDLSHRLKRGAYRSKPVRRVYIPKADGRQRPLGVTALEDKVVQRAMVEVLNAIYETDFLGFSYGFRPVSVSAVTTRVDETLSWSGTARCVGRARGWHREPGGELDTGRRHQRVFRQHQPGVSMRLAYQRN